jgi:hypothetical protein
MAVLGVVMKPKALVIAVLIGVAISALSLIGYVELSQSWHEEAKSIIIAIYVLATLALFGFASRALTKASVIAVALTVAVLSVIMEQLLGFYIFQGLAKDVTAFDAEHFYLILKLMLTSIIWYLIVAMAAIIGTQSLSRR